MDTFSSSVTPNFHVPKPLNPTHHHHFRPTTVSHHHAAVINTATAPSIYKNKPSSTTSFPQKDNFTPLYPRYSPKTPSLPPVISLNFKPPRSSIHRKPASGYAAALLDIAQCNGVVLEVARDVKRLLRLLRNGHVREFMADEMVEERVKGKAVKELVEKGKFDGHLVGLVKMVIDKCKRVDMVKEALEEFESILYQLAPSSPAMALN